MKIGFASGSPRFPLESQIAQLEAWGAKKLFIREKGETWEDFLGTLRPTSQPGVTHLHRIADSRTEVFRAIDAFVSNGLLLWVTSRKCFVDGNSVVAVSDMISYFAGLSKMPTEEIAIVRARRSNEARAKNDPLKGKTRLVEKMWKDCEAYRTDSEAVYAISQLLGFDISKATLYRRFDGSGRPRGNPHRK